MSIERRYTAGRVELRMGTDSTFGGYAAKYETPSKNLGGFIEEVGRSFFNRSASRGFPDVVCRYNHHDNMLLGTTSAGTLRLQTDDVGLRYEVDPPKARQDIVELVQRGDLTKSSFAFQVHEDDWQMSDQGFPLRSLISGKLIDVAPVVTPAYEDTSVDMADRSLDAALSSLAAKVHADLAEVRSLARANELRKLLVRTDIDGGAPRKLSAAARLAQAKAISL